MAGRIPETTGCDFENMKKIIIGSLIGIVALVIIAGLAVHFFLDSAIKKGVEMVGPRLVKVEVKLKGASLSLLSGSGKLEGLVVGNPEGYTTPSAISVGAASVAVQPGSIFSDKIVIRSVQVAGPEITLEASLHGSNLGKILDNLKAAGGGDKEPAASKDEKGGKKLQVNEFVITGGRIHVSFVGLAGKTATLPLPEIRLQDLGKGPEGITGSELARQVLSAVLKGSIEASSSAVTDLGKDAGKAVKGLGDLFKKSK